MSESLGTARLDLVVDTSGFEAAVERSKNIAAGLGDAAAAAFTKADSNAKKGATSLIRWSELLGKSADEQKLLNAAIRGVPMEIIEAVAGKLNKVRQEAAASAVAVRDLAAAEQQAAAFAAAGAQADEANRLREQQRVVAALTRQFEALEAAERQEAEFALAAKTAAENDYIREQQRVVRALTEQFHALEAAEAAAAQRTEFLSSLQAQANAIGKNRSELLAMKAAEMGVSAEAAPFIAKLREQEQALTRAGIAFNKYGLSAKQTQAALRQVPAQITDIFVSLQGGQNPLTVLLQQGGQLKDIFGGVRPALAGLASGLVSLINPMTLTIGTAAALFAVFAKGERDVTRFNEALITTGDLSGRTSDDLSDLARELDGMAGVTQNSASSAIAAVVASGRVAADQQELVARAALAMQVTTGKAIEDTVAEFAELARDPVTAILKLNEAQHFLTEGTIQQIEALKEQGDIAGAARVAQEAYANTLIERSGKITERLGYLESAWKAVKRGAAEAWDAMLDVGREDTLSQRLQAAQERVANAQKSFDEIVARNGGKLADSQREYLQRGLDNARDKLKDLQAEARDVAANVGVGAGAARARGGGRIIDSPEYRLRKEAEKEFASLVQSNLTKEQQLTAEIARIRQVGLKAGKSEVEIEQQIAAAKRKAAEANRGERGLGKSEMRNDLAQFKAALEEELAAINGNTQILRAEYAARLTDASTYYAKLRELAAQELAAQEKSILGQIDALKARSASGKDAIDIATKITELEGQLARVRQDAATKSKVASIEEEAAARSRQYAIEDYADALQDSTDALRDSVNAEIAAIGIGQAEADLRQKLRTIYDEQREALEKLNKEKARDPNAAATYAADVAALQAATDERVRIVTDGYRRMQAAQQDWMAGVRASVQDWMEQAGNVSSQVRDITTSSMREATDAISNFAMTGKLAIKDLLRSILAELVKFFAQQAVLNFVKMFLPSFGLGNIGSAASGAGSGVLGGIASVVKNANGNSFPGGTSLPTNAVLTKPTFFAFAKGAAFNGVAGEAGPEAIMPLKRGPDGKLGVQASGAGGGNVINMSVNTTLNADGTAQSDVQGDQEQSVREFTDRMRFVAAEELQRALRPGGTLWRAGVKA